MKKLIQKLNRRFKNKAKQVCINEQLYEEITNVNYTLKKKHIFRILEEDNVEPAHRLDVEERQDIYDFFDMFDYSDINTRQAVFQPKYKEDNTKAACTSCIQVLIRDNKINMFVHVRSQNLLNNFDYDNQTYCIIIKHLSQKLNVEIGKIYVRIASLHFC